MRWGRVGPFDELAAGDQRVAKDFKNRPGKVDERRAKSWHPVPYLPRYVRIFDPPAGSFTKPFDAVANFENGAVWGNRVLHAFTHK